MHDSTLDGKRLHGILQMRRIASDLHRKYIVQKETGVSASCLQVSVEIKKLIAYFSIISADSGLKPPAFSTFITTVAYSLVTRTASL